MTRASTKPQSSSKWCQSRPLRASREASKHSTAPTSPAHSHATSRSKPGRATIGGPAEIVIDYLDVVEAPLPRDINKFVLPPLALEIGLDLRLSRLPNIDHRLALQHCRRQKLSAGHSRSPAAMLAASISRLASRASAIR